MNSFVVGGLLVISTVLLSGCSLQTLLERDQAESATGSTAITRDTIMLRFQEDIGALNLNRLNLSVIPDICELLTEEERQKVRSLDLSSNQISVVDTDLSCLPSLASVDLSFNGITEFVGLGTLPALQELLIHKNKLSSLGGIAELTGLQHLNIGFNSLTQMLGIENLKNLVQLEIYHNQIESLIGVEGLEKLQTLKLEFNNLINTGILQKLPSLKEITGL